MHRNSWLIGIVALALIARLASAQDGPNRAAGKGEATAKVAPSSSVKFTNRLSSTAVFIENKGQFDARVKFQAKIGGKTAWLTAEGIVFDVTRPAANGASKDRAPGTALEPPRMLLPLTPGRALREFQTLDRLVFAEDLVRATCCSKVEGKELQPGIYNYFQGRDSSQWRTNVHGFAEVVYRDAWPGIDLRVYGNGPNLEQEFIVRPGADLSLVQVAYRGVDKLSIAGDGSLEVATAFGTLRETKPQIFQEMGGKRETVEGRYRLTSQASYAFDVFSHNPQYPLVIDPTLLYSTYLGSSGGFSNNYAQDSPNGIAVDASGSAYVAGNSASTDFPVTVGAFQVSPPGGSFITKLNATGSALIYSTYLGYFSTSITAIAVDSAGQAYVTGYTTGGSVFPTTPNAYWPTNSNQYCASTDSFVTEFNSAGNQLVYSSCLNYGAVPQAIAVNSNGQAYIAGGGANVAGLPTTANAFQPSYPGGASAFVSMFDTTATGASSLIYSSYLGPSDPNTNAVANGIAVDSFGKAYITGQSLNGAFPTTVGSFQPFHGPCNGGGIACTDVFVAKIDPSASGSQSLIYSTYIGGQGDDRGYAISVDAVGDAFVTGITSVPDSFPVTPGAFQTTASGANIAFVTKLNAGGSQLVYSTYVTGTSPNSIANGIAVDSLGNAYIAGTSAGGFPVTPSGFQVGYGGSGLYYGDAFLTELNPTGSGLVYSTYLGGTVDDVATGIALDQAGDAYVTGWTGSPNFPVSPTAFQPVLNLGRGGCEYCFPEDGFVTKFPLGTSQTLSISSLQPTSGGNTGPVTLSIQGGGFHGGLAVSLVGGMTIAASALSVGSEGRTVSATFDLTGASAGSYALSVVNSDGTSATAPQAFTVQQGGAPNIQVYVTGLDVAHGTAAHSVAIVTVSNTGNVDSAGALVSEPVVAPFSLTSTTPQPIVSTNSSVGWITPPVPAGASVTFISTAAGTITAAAGTSLASTSTAAGPIIGATCAVFFGPVCFTQNLAATVACISQDAQNAINCSTATVVCGAASACIAANPFLPGLCSTLVGQCIGTARRCLNDPLVQGCIQNNASSCTSSVLPCVQAVDPNTLVGPPGIGGQRWISGGQALTYGISFSNEPTAPVPAQQVVVTQPLSANVNLNTLTVLGINLPNGAASVQVPVPAGSFNPGAGVSEFTTVADLRPGQSLLVNVDAKLNASTETLTWTLSSIDPATGQPPVNPLIGLLPPGAGGSVFFTVTPVPGLATGTQISDEAAVVFDGNAALSTPTWTNTIDNTPPVSAVSGLAATQTTSCFRPQWMVSDVGSGVQGTTIFVSDTGGPYTPWLTNTTLASAIYNGVAGHTYAFYSQATDLVGNVQVSHTNPDASTTVQAGASCNGRPTIAGSIAGNSLSGSTETLTLQLTNNGVGNAQNIKINSVSLRTLVGTGAVALSSPATPISVGSLAAGASTTQTFTLNAPSTVREYSITEAGTVQDAAGNTYSFSIAEAVIP